MVVNASVTSILCLPRLVFGEDSSSQLAAQLSLLSVRRPLLISDRGLERAGIVASILRFLPDRSPQYLDVPENPTATAADEASALYVSGGCDGVVALGGGSVIDMAKIVAALGTGGNARARDLLGKPDQISSRIAPLIAIPTTVGTGSESSSVAALHAEPNGPAIGTRSSWLVPRVAICDPLLARTLPRRLVAATGIDALSHCIEGYLAVPASPIIDALALEGMRRVFSDIRDALEPEGDGARGSLMVAAFAGGAAIQKGLGPAHAIALACSDQELHHGTLIGIALPVTVGLVISRTPGKGARLAEALGLHDVGEVAGALRALTKSLGLPASLTEAGYRANSIDDLVESMIRSPFNRSSPYAPTRQEYREMTTSLLA
jgi:4-hydroxybutyrate dehydrogenase